MCLQWQKLPAPTFIESPVFAPYCNISVSLFSLASLPAWSNWHTQLAWSPGMRLAFPGAEDHGILIACSREAKQAGIKNVMDLVEACKRCSDFVLVPHHLTFTAVHTMR